MRTNVQCEIQELKHDLKDKLKMEYDMWLAEALKCF